MNSNESTGNDAREYSFIIYPQKIKQHAVADFKIQAQDSYCLREDMT